MLECTKINNKNISHRRPTAVQNNGYQINKAQAINHNHNLNFLRPIILIFR